MGYRVIVLGTDGSETAGVAEGVAAALSSSCGAEVIVVCAHGGPRIDAEAAHEAVGRAAERIGKEGIAVRTEAVEAEPAEAIVEAADRSDADLIVVGDVGMGPARRLHLGDVPDQVAHNAPCDVLIVETASPKVRDPRRPYRTMLVGTDGSPTATEATRKAFELAEVIGSEVTLIHVGDPIVGAIVLEQAAKDRPGRARVQTLQVEGAPADRINEAAERGKFDLVVVGNKGMAGARRLLGSVPDRVAHDSTTDVLIAKTVGRSIEDLAPGHGGVVEANGKRVAAYRGEDGILHAVSPRCTHMGCTVDWNDREKTWDCPCHGSRYRWDGAVFHGPARRDLPLEDVAPS